MRALPLALMLTVSAAGHAFAQSLHGFCAAGAKPVQSDPRLADAIRAEFGPVSFDSKADECTYPLKVLRYAAADVLVTHGNVPGEACHGCGARLSAYVLRRFGGGLRPVARFIDFAQAGTFGSAGDITPLTIGGDDGLVIESGGTFQGFTSAGLDLYVFKVGHLVQLTADPPIPTGSDNEGATGEGGQPIDVTASWSVAPLPGAALTVDYKVRAHGRTRVERAVWTLQGSRLVLTQAACRRRPRRRAGSEVQLTLPTPSSDQGIMEAGPSTQQSLTSQPTDVNCAVHRLTVNGPPHDNGRPPC